MSNEYEFRFMMKCIVIITIYFSSVAEMRVTCFVGNLADAYINSLGSGDLS